MLPAMAAAQNPFRSAREGGRFLPHLGEKPARCSRRQSEEEAVGRAVRRDYADLPAVALDEPPYDREADSRSSDAPLPAAAPPGIEDPLPLSRRDHGPVAGDLQDPVCLVAHGRHL